MKTRKRATTYPVAHLVTPARRLAEARRGADDVTALCGAPIKGDPDPAAGVCADCMVAQFEADDRAHDARAQESYERGRDEGERRGRIERDREWNALCREQEAKDREAMRRLGGRIANLFRE